jgi:hypothetical protein
MDSKRCGRCREWLPYAAFARKAASKDGLQNWCRECTTAWAKAHRSRSFKAAPTVGPGEKWCRRCEVVQPVNAFAVNRTAPDGRQGHCRACFAAAYREKREQSGHVVRPADIPAGYKFCRGCQRVVPHSEWAVRSTTKDGLAFRCKTCMSASDQAKYLQRTYGMSVEDLDAMLLAQHGVCAICQTAPAAHVDHDHQTDKVRGQLCFRCNAALGQLGDDPLVVRRAARYLERGGFQVGPPEDAAEPQSAEPSVMERVLRTRLADADFGTAS